RDYFMALMADACNLPRQQDILAVPVRTAKRVARKGVRRKLSPRHNHSRVQSAGQGHANTVLALKVARQILREHFSKFLIVRFRLQSGLFFPFARLEVSLALDRAVANDPSGSRGHHIDAFEQRPILQNAAAGDEFAQATVTEFSELRSDG